MNPSVSLGSNATATSSSDWRLPRRNRRKIEPTPTMPAGQHSAARSAPMLAAPATQAPSCRTSSTSRGDTALSWKKTPSMITNAE